VPTGRPTKLDANVIAEMRRLLPVVMYIDSVAGYLGVTRVTIHYWVKRGRAEALRLEKANTKPKESEALYLEFFNTYQKALAQGELADCLAIKQASQTEWQAAAWRLERRFPKRWGRKTPVVEINNQTNTTKVDVWQVLTNQASQPKQITVEEEMQLLLEDNTKKTAGRSEQQQQSS